MRPKRLQILSVRHLAVGAEGLTWLSLNAASVKKRGRELGRRSGRHCQRRDAQCVSARSALARRRPTLALLQERDRFGAAHSTPARSAAGVMSRCSTSTCWCCGKWTRSPTGSPRAGRSGPSELRQPRRRKPTGATSARATAGCRRGHLRRRSRLGTLGLEVNILTPEFGPRVYLTGVLTELELEADRPLTEQVCIGESCSRCLHSCPADAVLHFGIDKRACATEAQEFGFSTILAFFERFIDAPLPGKGAYGALARCLRFLAGIAAGRRFVRRLSRCLAVCPVGNDYHSHLADFQKAIPEKTPEKVALANAIATTAPTAPKFPASTIGTGAG